jgi:hypothetical protein
MRVLGDGEMEFVEPMVNTSVVPALSVLFLFVMSMLMGSEADHAEDEDPKNVCMVSAVNA